MPVENAIDKTSIREGDIYRQFALALLQMNEFAYSIKAEKFELNNAQKLLSIFAGITNRYLLKRIGDGDDEISRTAAATAKNLICRQEKFVKLDKDKITDFTHIKIEGLSIMEEYDRLLLKHGIFK